ncbi:MAG: 4-hydroxy-tetrahydrodipicolinate reductase [Woeseiaceae bacterium]|nr:4-hydroxy-tetrahydrodipicolinate reductase [Woeseiaceae bacterium]NIP20205.1 4-hydroxy-tetrahydrodipicolinate reductase [Woeseiaceae bacterium]NIS89001.1 4-hydroxy-tetrahydrodipicolinate reductase [Woeseiaceae bacterium]
MGQAIADGIAAADDLALAGIWKRGDDLLELARSADVIVDFSLPEATETVLQAALEHRVPLVCGVSGLSGEQLRSLDEASRTIAIVYDRNMSLGIAVLENLVREAARVLGDDFAVRIHETHHVHKVDAPSGTALKLGEAVAEVRGTDPANIEYESERRGEVPGDHEVMLASPTESLTLRHSVTTRQVFADGALRAARWVAGKSPGMFTMHDVLE